MDKGSTQEKDRDHKDKETRVETSLYRFNTASDGRMVAFLKTDRDSEWYCTYTSS